MCLYPLSLWVGVRQWVFLRAWTTSKMVTFIYDVLEKSKEVRRQIPLKI